MMESIWQLIEELETELAFYKSNNYPEDSKPVIRAKAGLKQAYEQLEEAKDV